MSITSLSAERIMSENGLTTELEGKDESEEDTLE